MLEVIVPVIIATISGSAVLFNRLHNRIHDLDRRADGIELRMVESFVTKGDFNATLNRVEKHMLRIEDKLDKIVENSKK